MVLNKKAILKFGEHTQFSLEEIDNMFVDEFFWWIKTKEEYINEMVKKLKEANQPRNVLQPPPPIKK